YSVTFGQIRRARRRFRANAASLAPDADVRQVLDEPIPEGFVLVSSWVFDGLGYLDLDGSAAAVSSACRARARPAGGRPAQANAWRRTSMRKQEQQQPRLIPPRLWNVRETAEYLGVPTSTLYSWSYL